ncbi:uncharacterized protein BYT42DRAFT_435 [Radiomyces spectabilis]|uniref:uncharacterized protein n=1 Tax=Radiomyces spectabilis TaxID=64574 RepID=UPI00221F43C4|nr:uncharacterized protein BYT42DRAFT_435 [Radiomyces spectabilis]KAI8393268.1 hypothetical protein BYT42DRAFT_435 [Radiomyces spectabilis]
MKDYNLQPSTKCFNHLMDAYANVKDVESVIATFKRMKEEGLKADIYTYGTLIKTFVQSSRLEDAFVIFRKMKTANMIPSQPIFSMLLSGCITMQDIDRAWRVFDEMRLAYHQPDEVSFTLMLHACAERGEVERALNLFEDMTSQHLYPTDVTFNVLINACAKRSDYFDEAFSLLQQMQENGFKPDRITYNTLLSACARKKHLALAREIYRSMLQDTDVSPDQYTYANFFWCYASFNPRPAIENQAAEDAPVKQEQDEESNSLVSHSILFPQLPDRRSKVVAEAKAVFHYMLQQHIPVNTPLLNAYISTHISQKQDRECLQLYEQFDDMKVQRDGYTFLSMLQFCYNKRDASLAWKVWEDYQDFLEKRAAMFLPSDDPLQAKRIANDRTYAQHREGWSLPQQRALTLLMANTLAKTNDLQHSLSLLVTHFKKGGPLASLAIKYEDVKTIHNKCIQLEDMDAKQELMSLYAPRRPRLAPAKYRRVNM